MPHSDYSRKKSRKRQRRSSDSDEDRYKSEVRELRALVQALMSDKRVSKPNFMGKNNVISEFRPEGGKITAEKWVHQIEQLAEINNWDENTKIYNMQAKLEGLAKEWFGSLHDYKLTWEEWKEKLVLAFPEAKDFHSILVKMVERKKIPSETMTNFYYEKSMLLRKLGIFGRDAVSCIIAGLDSDNLRSSAKAGNFATPEKLFTDFLANFNEPTSSSSTASFVKPTSSTKRLEIEGKKPVKILKCYNCKDKGHIATECPKPKIKCEKCHRYGHKTSECRLKSNSVKKINLPVEAEKNYFMSAKVNGTTVKAFIDTGSSVTIITESAAKAAELPIVDSNVMLTAYGGSKIMVSGESQAKIELGDSEAEIPVVVVTNEIQDVDLIVGRTYINNHKTVMMVINGQVSFMRNDLDELSDDVVENEKVILTANEDTEIPSLCAMQVSISSNKINNCLYVENRNVKAPQCSYVVPSCIINSSESLPIVNLSLEPITIKAGQRLARGVNCIEKEIILQRKNVSELSHNELDTELTGVNKQELIALINEFSDCFANDYSEIGCAKCPKMKISLTSETPVVYRPYRLPFTERDKTRQIISELLTNGIISESFSNFASPIVLVSKKNGDKRMCVDYRKLNQITIKDKYPLPLIEDTIDQLRGFTQFTTLDLFSGYHQIEIDEESRHKTAFVTPDGHYEYNRIPFGLANAPAFFQRAITNMFGPVATVFIDDIIVPSTDFEHGIKQLRKVLEIGRRYNVTFNYKKCVFFKSSVRYLGYEINYEGLRPGDAKVKAVKEFPVPENVRNVRQFIGLASFFRKFVQNFAQIAKPLTRKNENFRWEKEQE